ncbi:thiamine pyrophosphate-binding protein [Thermoactinomyces vulgaris]|nr:thiamine pyrophosphate-binding protein [Thermoactinomyces vulgaris]
MIGMEDRTVAKHLLDQLTEWGCERIYGVIGDANLELLDELAKQDRIRYIACRHETAAALMASAEAKLTGKLAVCMATSGPGIALLINGLADAYFDRAPVLAVTGQVATKNMGTGSHQEIDQQRLVQPVVQYSATTVNPEAFPTQLNLAAKTALARGTVAHLSIPKDLWKQTVRSRLFPLPPPDPSVIAYQEEYQTVLKLLEQAGRPVLLAGRGIRNVREEVVRLAEKLTAPIITTMPAKSCVPNDHPLFVGGLGQGGSEASTQLLHEADLCLILGATWWPEDKRAPGSSRDPSGQCFGKHRADPCPESCTG